MAPNNSERVLAAIEDARRHGLLQLAQSNLVRVPPPVFSLATTLVRLDLSANLLTTVPDEVASLTQLQSLWLSDNPRLAALPAALAQCAQLTVLDVRATALRSLPCELARLAWLRVLDLGDTPLERIWIAKGHLPAADTSSSSTFTKDAQRDQCQRVLRKLTRKDERAKLKRELFDKLHDEVYRVEKRDTAGEACLRRTIRRLLKLFPLADELRSVIRNAERLFPVLPAGATHTLVDALDAIADVTFRASFDQLKTENERKKRAADLELKIRALYFDRVEPKRVEPMVQSIYAEIRELKDIKFLLKHAAALFPPEPKDVDGKDIYRRVLALQQDIARERQVAVDKLLTAVKAVYSDAEPDAVLKLVTAVAALFKNTKDLRSLAADASMLFPNEFLNAQPSEIRAAFVQQKNEALGGTTTTATMTATITSPKTRTKP